MRAAPRKWYALAIKLKDASTDALSAVRDLVGRGLSKQQLCTLRKLAKVPRLVGELLDELGAPWPLVRFVAHGASPEVQTERARDRLADYLDKKERKTGQRDELARALERVLLEQTPAATNDVRKPGHAVQKAGRSDLGAKRGKSAA